MLKKKISNKQLIALLTSKNKEVSKLSFSYSGNPENSRLDAIRFMIGDTNEDGALMQDEEVNYIINQNADNETAQVINAFRQAATILGIRTVKKTLGPQSEDATARLKYYNEMATKLEKRLRSTVVPPLPDYQYITVFEKGMMAGE